MKLSYCYNKGKIEMTIEEIIKFLEKNDSEYIKELKKFFEENDETVISSTQVQIDNTLQIFETVLGPSIEKYKRQTEEIKRIIEEAEKENN